MTSFRRDPGAPPFLWSGKGLVAPRAFLPGEPGSLPPPPGGSGYPDTAQVDRTATNDDGPRMRALTDLRAVLAVALLVGLVSACGGSGSGGSGTTISPPVEAPPDGEDCEGAKSYASTWEAVQEIIFERHGCREQVCHGSNASGGLDLRTEVAYGNLVEAPSASYRFARVTPGDNDRSYLWLKLAAKTLPGAVDGVGTPMPSGLPAISEDELELLRRWIYGGAPEAGTVLDTAELVDGCLPPIEPLTIAPLPPPEPGVGAQLVMPSWLLPAGSEHEICFASYYDISDQVPDEFLEPGGERVRIWSSEMRQDPQSHHLLVSYVDPDSVDIHDPAFGPWACKDGERAGSVCEPTDLSSCGADGHCATDFMDGFACLNFGPQGTSFFQREGLPGGSQAAQSFSELPPGVFRTMPVRGIIYWNSHAFNLTTKDHLMHARVNAYFAGPENQDIPERGIFDVSEIFTPTAAPFEEETLCNGFVLPRNAHLFDLSSHTHQRGKHFTAELRDGTLIYESFIYNDPLNLRFDPPMVFDSEDPAERTITFCSLYNNGRNPDGSPNVEEVTRYSRLPQSVFQPGVPGRCRPVACVNEGMIGAPCNGQNDDSTCDTSPGAGDGWCDACPITGGESTENEMFLPLGSYYVP
jgi:hypothetical protein